MVAKLNDDYSTTRQKHTIKYLFATCQKGGQNSTTITQLHKHRFSPSNNLFANCQKGSQNQGDHIVIWLIRYYCQNCMETWKCNKSSFAGMMIF